LTAKWEDDPFEFEVEMLKTLLAGNRETAEKITQEIVELSYNLPFKVKAKFTGSELYVSDMHVDQLTNLG
ncbi:MAG: hypothetical protein AB2541_02810, partial [Candidatus Thiodiazotropha sp.]